MFPFKIHLLQRMRKILDNGKRDVRLRPESKDLAWK